MRRLLAVLAPLALLAACGDDDVADGPTTAAAGDTSETTVSSADAGDEEAGSENTGADQGTPPETTDAADAPAGDAPAGSGEDDEGLGDALLVSNVDGAAEVPGPGDPDATGRFEGELHEGVLCVDMLVTGLDAPVTGAHLHDGPAGEAGEVIVDIGLPSEAATDAVRWVDACTEVADEVIERIAAAPERVYVNVHTSDLPDGAVRGQLSVASVFDRALED